MSDRTRFEKEANGMNSEMAFWVLVIYPVGTNPTFEQLGPGR